VYNAVLFMLLFIKCGERWEIEICTLFSIHPVLESTNVRNTITGGARQEGDINKDN
jgi:hypothetical protein